MEFRPISKTYLELKAFPWSSPPVVHELGPADVAMARYGAGDDAALAVVYDELAPRLYSFLVRRTRDQALSEDLVQQTFLQMHRARATFEPGSLVSPWAFAIAKRLWIDTSRARARKGQEAGASEASELTSSDASAEEVVFVREVGARATAELQKMPANQRDAFMLIRIDGLSVVEAAQVLGTTVSAVKLRAHRAYKALADALGHEFAGMKASEEASE